MVLVESRQAWLDHLKPKDAAAAITICNPLLLVAAGDRQVIKTEPLGRSLPQNPSKCLQGHPTRTSQTPKIPIDAFQKYRGGP